MAYGKQRRRQQGAGDQRLDERETLVSCRIAHVTRREQERGPEWARSRDDVSRGKSTQRPRDRLRSRRNLQRLRRPTSAETAYKKKADLMVGLMRAAFPSGDYVSAASPAGRPPSVPLPACRQSPWSAGQSRPSPAGVP